ncbi:hypothetical protein VP01_4202g1 [Puccinia sorghi]|uniref:Uncharacterized protein n=1 Tax=Puccinia sorghi TaxID=27349 RepID=A0A0L6USQ9_9BASI|nr:hypothetical protein VP01_4202g1 [Puccinia sorghi]
MYQQEPEGGNRAGTAARGCRSHARWTVYVDARAQIANLTKSPRRRKVIIATKNRNRRASWALFGAAGGCGCNADVMGSTPILTTGATQGTLTIRSESGNFLDKIWEWLCDAHRTLLSVETVHNNLVKWLSITLKNPDTINIHKHSFQWRPHHACPLCGSPAARTIVKQDSNQLNPLPAIGIDGIIAMTNPYPNHNLILVRNNTKVHKGVSAILPRAQPNLALLWGYKALDLSDSNPLGFSRARLGPLGSCFQD